MNKEQSRQLLLDTQKTLELKPTEMGMLLTGYKKGYATYKNWIATSSALRLPTHAVLSHVHTLLDWHDLDATTCLKVIERKLKKIKESE